MAELSPAGCLSVSTKHKESRNEITIALGKQTLFFFERPLGRRYGHHYQRGRRLQPLRLPECKTMTPLQWALFGDPWRIHANLNLWGLVGA